MNDESSERKGANRFIVVDPAVSERKGTLYMVDVRRSCVPKFMQDKQFHPQLRMISKPELTQISKKNLYFIRGIRAVNTGTTDLFVDTGRQKAVQVS
ncbi:hypothetical protein Pla110_30240 [Polystyrenella longa]|uniref:Uncharacterized protein n=1 Tax=Polystyrenella longa TaxID=2528007 RepID=A0A518CPY2_9PLAN|nr:hypothetical protein Pla110_30240 [Polystyrenella longa]